MDDLLARLHGALLPLEAPPGPRGWNHEDMAELIGDAPRRAAAVLIGIRDDREQRVVLTVRTDTLQQHAGQVAFPGGRVEDHDEDAVATALRESHEEIGLDARMVTPLGFLESFETISGYSVTPVVARIAAEATLTPDPGEVAEVFEVPFAFFLEPANLRRYTMDFRGHRRDMVEFLHAGYRIWGVTAAILLNLLKRMGHHPC
ncbi:MULTISPECIES: CoA pyrophosphatase [Luteibacter]|uniref:CoA pyrophosphatase n=1 Tax=Luteibacter TaxID=242605 RepID=UPI00055BB8A6